MRLVIFGTPITKKNSQQILRDKMGRAFIAPSTQYKKYEAEAVKQLQLPFRAMIDWPVNVACIYFMPTRRRCDLCNLLEATDDILVKAEILEDDNSRVIAGHDGSRVFYDKDNPRVEIEITDMEEEMA